MRLALATLGKWIVYGCLLLSGYATCGAASDRPTVILYTVAGCEPCKRALKSLREIGIEPTVTRDCPSWVTQTPTIHWRDRAGVWRQHAPQHWSGKNWSELETEKLRRWLLMPSATKSTARGGYLTVTLDSLPAPYYQRGPVKLYHGDCLELLPHISGIDAVVTDPPYSSGGQFRSDRSQSTSSKYLGSHGRGPKVEHEFSGDSRDSRGWLFWATLWMIRCHECCNASALAMIFTDWRQFPQCSDVFQAANWVWRGCAVWDKGNARPMSGRFSHQSEFILWGSKGAIGWDFEKPCASGVLRYDAPKEHHQTEKPVGLISEMLEITAEGGTVLDPFFGSGTTAIACIETGRKFVGCELSEANCRIAASRCDAAIDQLRIQFEPAKRVETQRELFAEVANG